MSEQDNIKDLSMVDLFLMETANQCSVMASELTLLDTNSSEAVNFDSIYRAIHSIKGTARIVDLQTIISLSTAMENVLHGHGKELQSNTDLQSTFLDCVKTLKEISQTQASELQSSLLDQKNHINELIISLQEHLDRLQPSQDEPPAPQIRPSLNSPLADMTSLGLFDIFKEDAENHLAVLSDNLIQIEKEPQNAPLLESSMRAMHSFKGAARIIELNTIVKLAHCMEDIFVAAQNNSIVLTPEFIDLLFAAVDLLKNLIKENENSLDEWLQANNDSINLHLQQLNSVLQPSALSSTTQVDSSDDNDVSSANDVSREIAIRGKEPEAHKERRQQVGSETKDQTLRVSATGMSRMMALAGEALVESRWLPNIANKTHLLKRKLDDIWRSIEGLRNQTLEKHYSTTIENSFDNVMQVLKECQGYITDHVSEVEDHSRKATDISHRLHHEIIINRMQPLSEGIKGLPRLVRDLGRKQNKNIQLEVIGSETMVDRDILESLESPLVHIITNAIDHGIESDEERLLANKPPESTISIEAKHVYGMLHINISDDGRGIDLDNLRKKIVSKKLISETIANELSEYELYDFLFLPNFSTRKSVNRTSGRGVGLDIVLSTIREVRGTVQLFSIAGSGTIFELKLPLTLSIIRGLIAEINQEPYSFPLVNIDHVIKLPRNEIKEENGLQYFLSKNDKINLITAQQVLELVEPDSNQEELSIIVLNNEQKSYGLIVDSFQGIRDLVVQSINPILGKLRSISAGSITEDGAPVLIIDVQDLIHSMDHLITGDRLNKIDPTISDIPAKTVKKILIVDDSVTVREVERRVLLERGFEVDVAVDGLEAWNMIKNIQYDMIITDIDMPHMDGFELLYNIKDSLDHEMIPVIIVSYKDREEDKNRGLESGADYFLTKGSFHNQTLLNAVEDLIGGPEEEF